jgi:hypothetical protein
MQYIAVYCTSAFACAFFDCARTALTLLSPADSAAVALLCRAATVAEFGLRCGTAAVDGGLAL